jgi:hypothetical protein
VPYVEEYYRVPDRVYGEVLDFAYGFTGKPGADSFRDGSTKA